MGGAGPGTNETSVPVGGASKKQSPAPGQRGGVAGSRRAALRPRPRLYPSLEGRKLGEGGSGREGEEAAVAVLELERFSRAPAEQGSKNVAPYCSSSRRRAVPSGHVPEQASRRGLAARARGQRDLQVSARANRAEPAGPGAVGRSGGGAARSPAALWVKPLPAAVAPAAADGWAGAWPRLLGGSRAGVCGLAPPLLRPGAVRCVGQVSWRPPPGKGIWRLGSERL